MEMEMDEEVEGVRSGGGGTVIIFSLFASFTIEC